jgi:hypothetical protein
VHNFAVVSGLERNAAIFASRPDLAVALDDGHGIGHPLASEKVVDRPVRPLIGQDEAPRRKRSMSTARMMTAPMTIC